MPRIKPLKKEEAEGEAKEVLENMEKQLGMIPNVFASIAHYPKALKPIRELYRIISKESTIDPKLQELANLEISRINCCHYCLTHHTQMAKAAGLKDEKLKALEAGELEQSFSEQEKTVIEYARQVTLDAENIPDELFKRLKFYFSDSEIVNLTLIIGLMNVFNCFNSALAIELEK